MGFDPNIGASRSEISAPRGHFAITPDDVTELPHYPETIWVGVGGDLAVELTENDTVCIYKNVEAGRWIGKCRRVLATGTTATDLIGCY